MKRWLTAVCFAVTVIFFSGITALAQQASRSDARSVLHGVAIDSLRGGFLRDATIMVRGGAGIAITDSLGRFRIDGVMPGAARVDVMHPVLDTIGLALVTPELAFKAGDSVPIVVAIPSAATIVARKCSAAERAKGPGALFGLVLNAEEEEPAPGAHISLTWVDIEISKKNIGRMNRSLGATSGHDGRFRICGLPEDFTAGVQAWKGVDTTAAIAVTLAPTVATEGLYLSLPRAGGSSSSPIDAQGAPTNPQSRLVPLRGRVTTKAGSGVAGARVSLDDAASYAVTETDGSFTISGARSGTRRLTIRKLGFAPVEVPVSRSARDTTPVVITLAEAVPVLGTVQVRAVMRDVGLARVGFSERKRRGTGRYLDIDQIERRGAHDLASLLTGTSGIRVQYSNGQPVITGRPSGFGNGCVNYYVDGMIWMGGGVEQFIVPPELAAVEVYTPGFTPAAFARMGDCTTIVLWTKWKVGVK
ncbi:MAG: carboxypeptidase regulatory-like domain-containing protein [Gemmatimonadaceae bacterium]|nr:carboxypeptidase regulatory-like domain-containing protein [Gemmatimonadaceae bacterium]